MFSRLQKQRNSANCENANLSLWPARELNFHICSSRIVAKTRFPKMSIFFECLGRNASCSKPTTKFFPFLVPPGTSKSFKMNRKVIKTWHGILSKIVFSRGASLKNCRRGTTIFTYSIFLNILKIELSPTRELNFDCFQN